MHAMQCHDVHVLACRSLAQRTRVWFGECGRLNSGETVDMPVFFFIDPEILKDRSLRHVRNIVLSYTFFESNDQSIPEIQKAAEALSAAAAIRS